MADETTVDVRDVYHFLTELQKAANRVHDTGYNSTTFVNYVIGTMAAYITAHVPQEIFLGWIRIAEEMATDPETQSRWTR